MKNQLSIVGVGQSAFSRKGGLSVRELCFEAYKEAMEDAKGVKPQDIDATIVCTAPNFDNQRLPAPLISEYLGLVPKPTFEVASACSSSSTGLRIGWSMITSGLHNVIAVIGFQKMMELSSTEGQAVMGRADDTMFSSPFGTMMPLGHAMFARAHMDKFGTTHEQLALIREKNSSYGAMNEKAAFRKKLTLEEILAAPIISDPLKKFDCCANADGASCIIIAKSDMANDFTEKSISVLGLGMAVEKLNWSARNTLVKFDAAREAAKQAYKMAGVAPQDIDVAEVHDCFTIAEILAYEALGFAELGEGSKLIEQKETYIGGKIPVNIDGGLLSKGHPVGATGGSQIRTIVKQLRGEGDKVQVKDAKIGLVHNVGGVGTYANVTILGRD
jgi:acetyl-CoA C-acetyltransferase